VHHQKCTVRLLAVLFSPATADGPFFDRLPADKTTTAGTRQSVRIRAKYFRRRSRPRRLARREVAHQAVR
jgi:hypothetical protein